MYEPDLTRPMELVAESTNDSPRPSESLAEQPAKEQQAEYLAAYRLQLRRMACPGCGEGEPVF